MKFYDFGFLILFFAVIGVVCVSHPHDRDQHENNGRDVHESSKRA